MCEARATGRTPTDNRLSTHAHRTQFAETRTAPSDTQATPRCLSRSITHASAGHVPNRFWSRQPDLFCNTPPNPTRKHGPMGWWAWGDVAHDWGCVIGWVLRGFFAAQPRRVAEPPRKEAFCAFPGGRVSFLVYTNPMYILRISCVGIGVMQGGLARSTTARRYWSCDVGDLLGVVAWPFSHSVAEPRASSGLASHAIHQGGTRGRRTAVVARHTTHRNT